MKVWKITRAILYTFISILIFVFSNFFIQEIRFLVGGLMLLYGVPGIIIFAVKTRNFAEHSSFFWCLIETILGFVTIFLLSDYESICVVWGIWSILREAFEIEEAVINLCHLRPGIISIIESAVCSIFSILLVMNPAEHHAMIHAFYILPIELISTSLLYPGIDLLYDHLMKNESFKAKIESHLHK